MKIRNTILFSALIILASLACVSAASVFDGYAGNPWGTNSHLIIQNYKNGFMGKLGDQIIYKQSDPNKTIRQRTFAFRDNMLTAVSVSFNGSYVKKTGLENLLAIHKKSYGEGKMDRTNAPHLLTYIWETPKTKISFAYTPKKPEYTIVMYQMK